MKNIPSLWRSDRENAFRALQRDLDQMMNQFGIPFESNWPSRIDRALSSYMNFNPPCDIEETDSHYLVSMDLPGVNKEELKIDINEDQLRVYGERREEHQKSKRSFTRNERYYGSFERLMALPKNVKAEEIEAHFENGVLQIVIPKAMVGNAKQIPVGEGKGGFLSKLFGKKDSPPSSLEKGTPPSDGKVKVA